LIGSRIAHYEITAKIGEGGMGEVYRARDTKLDRDVAVKVLPAAFTEDAERLARFEREAKLLAQLHHPNIASIFGVEESGGIRALVMELVEGPTLAERLDEGPLPSDESLSLARQIAEALEEAHAKGIVHRDLKPQNVKASREGKIKVLDFGLAKAMDPAGVASGAVSSSQLAASPTLTLGATVQGVILGSAAYMAPEQARGLAADKRADIWAFGVVLYEMLVGRRLFEGELVTDVLASVINGPIDLDALPASTPAAIRRLLRRCLERKPKNRLHDIADARIVIDEVLSGAGDEEPAARAAPQGFPRHLTGREAMPWILALIFGFLLLLRIANPSGEGEAGPRRALEVSVPAGQLLTEEGGLAIAPDGSAIVFAATDPVRGFQLWLRRLDSFDAVPLNGTEGGGYPFWSPDSKTIGYFDRDKLNLCSYEVATGEVRVLMRTGNLGRGASWGEDGSLLYVPDANSPVQRLHLDGRPAEDLTVLDRSVLDASHRWPAPLPDGRHFLFTLWTNHLESAARVGGVYLASYERGILRKLTPDHSQAIVAGPDRIVVYRDGGLVALPFDPDKLEVTGPGQKLAEAPVYSQSSGALSASATPAGDLAFALSAGGDDGQLVWLDRAGEPTNAMGSERLSVTNLALAPDERRFAVQAPGASGNTIWVGDQRRQVLSRLTADAIDSMNPVWAPDGDRIAFVTEAEGSVAVFVQEADGSRPAELLLRDPERDFFPASWSGDGRYLLLGSALKSSRRDDIWLYDFETGAARELLGDSSASSSGAKLSTDGRWLAYSSDETGNPEVFVRPFPGLDRKWKVSQGGAYLPHWRADGRELVYLALADRSLFAVDVTPTAGGLEFGIPKLLFTPHSPLLAIAPVADHSRFLAGIIPGDVRAEPIRVIFRGRGESQ